MNMQIINKYKNLNIAVKAALWFTICNILQKGISIITVPIFTRILTTDQYGVYSLYLSWLNILTVIATLNLSYGVFNKAMIKFEDDRNRYISSMQGLTFTLVFSSFIFYIIFCDKLNYLLGLSTIMMIMMFTELALTPSLMFWSGLKRFEYKYKHIVIVTMIKSMLNPILGVIAVIISSNKVEARIFATVFLEILICGMIAIIQFYKGKCFFDKKYWKYALSFNIPLIPHYLSGSILNQGDRIIIQKLVSSSAVAKYSVAYNISMLVQLVTNAIAHSTTPWLYECLNKKIYKDINSKIRMILLLTACFSCVMMLFAPEIIVVFATDEYMDAIYVIPPVAASVFFIFAYTIYSNFEFYFEKRIFITMASVISAVLNLVLNFKFIPLFGYMAAAYTTLACYILYATAHLVFSCYILKIKLNNVKILKIKDFFLIGGSVLIYTIIVNIIYENSVIRYGIIVIIVFLGLAFKKRIVEIFLKLK